MPIRVVVPRLRAALGRGALLRRALFATVLGLIILSIIGMHQLSLGHDFSSPSVARHQRSDAQLTTAGAHDSSRYTPHLSRAATGLPDHKPDGSSNDSCPGCGGHDMALGACLLALTLLVLSWWLVPPRVRQLPPRTLSRPPAVGILRGRWVPALSLAELSVLRT